MHFLDKFLESIKLDDDYDDDEEFLDDEEEEDDDEEEEKSKPRKRFFSRFSSKDDDDEIDDERYDDAEDAPARARNAARSAERADSVERPAFMERTQKEKRSSRSERQKAEREEQKAVRRQTLAREEREENARREAARAAARKQKVTPIRKKSGIPNMEVNVIRPASMEDTREIADNLMSNSTVVLNLEGLDVDIAQRVIDFTCGVCYSLNGNLQKVSSYIFILTPADVDISGDFQSILNGAFDIPSMNSQY